MILARKIKKMQRFFSDFRYSILEELSGQSLKKKKQSVKFRHNFAKPSSSTNRRENWQTNSNLLEKM